MGASLKVVSIKDSVDRRNNGGKTGRPRGSDEIRERTQENKNLKRGATKKVLPDVIESDDLLPPVDELPESYKVHGPGAEWYERIRLQQLEWHNARGCKAFVKKSDLEAVVAVAQLYHAWRKILQEVENNEPVIDTTLITRGIKANVDYRKGLEGLGYIAGMYNHIDLKDVNDDEAALFND